MGVNRGQAGDKEVPIWRHRLSGGEELLLEKSTKVHMLPWTLIFQGEQTQASERRAANSLNLWPLSKSYCLCVKGISKTHPLEVTKFRKLGHKFILSHFWKMKV
jgi:hypothetical protein